jgi:hypothetical protein
MSAKEIQSDLERMRIGDSWESPADLPESFRAVRYEDGWLVQYLVSSGAIDLAEGMGAKEAAELIEAESQLPPEAVAG